MSKNQSDFLPVPPDENERLISIYNYKILDTENDEELDQLTRLTASIFHVPIALITIVDKNRQWFKSNIGLDSKETERSISFCQYTIMSNEIFEVENALKDERFEDNPLVTADPNIRFYAGAPLINEGGFKMGSLALIDTSPRKLEAEEKNSLRLLARQVVNHFELRMKKKELEKEKAILEGRVKERTLELQYQLNELNKKDEKLCSLNNELGRLIYRASHDLLGPLKTLQGITNLAIKEAREENVHYYLRLLYETEQKLDQTLMNLLKVVEVKEASDFTPISWKEIASRAFDNATKRNVDRKVKLTQDITFSSVFWSDPMLIQMMMEEIFLNSLQYNIREESHIDLKITGDTTMIYIQINDNGIGIREEEKEKIFEMFYKSPRSKGCGLGLYIVKNIVDKLGGQVFAETRKNEGTTINISLPIPPRGQHEVQKDKLV